jgi:hypothetical protein
MPKNKNKNDIHNGKSLSSAHESFLDKIGKKYVWPILSALSWGGDTNYWLLVTFFLVIVLLVKIVKWFLLQH